MQNTCEIRSICFAQKQPKNLPNKASKIFKDRHNPHFLFLPVICQKRHRLVLPPSYSSKQKSFLKVILFYSFMALWKMRLDSVWLFTKHVAKICHRDLMCLSIKFKVQSTHCAKIQKKVAIFWFEFRVCPSTKYFLFLVLSHFETIFGIFRQFLQTM